MRTFEEIKNTIETGLGKYPCDLKLDNVGVIGNGCHWGRFQLTP